MDNQGGKSVAKLNPDDFADLYESTRLEFRLHHDRTTYSRTKVVALTPAAVGETGDLILDEVGRVKAFREVWEAVRPIIASNPEFRCMLTTTPPPDDSHYSFELLAPPIGTEFKANPKGNWYKSEFGVWVLRIDAWDAYADGVPLYDDETGKPISPDEARAQDHDKDAWDRNYGSGLSSGRGRRGPPSTGRCPAARRREMPALPDRDGRRPRRGFGLPSRTPRARPGWGRCGLGDDGRGDQQPDVDHRPGGSRRGIRRPGDSRLEDAGPGPGDRAPDEGRRGNQRQAGRRPPSSLSGCVLGKYHCVNVRRALAHLVPVEDVVAGDGPDQPGGEPITKKALLGNDLVGILDDNRLTTARNGISRPTSDW